ncbi:MAG: hypothetical protein HY931_00775 [Candidatus Falkowbacteria bacterium]|nr:MAG: hypothetical protein HY931_00775 [Candidatus Falkowbacteria bacterium]
MEKYRPLTLLAAILVVLLFTALIIFGGKGKNAVVKADKELGYTIDSLKAEGVLTLTNITHLYLFDRLQDQTADGKKGFVILGNRLYQVNNLAQGCTLTPDDGNLDYHLEVVHTSAPVYQPGDFLDTYVIRKCAGRY